uniref:Uncharacterized protein n=1 Tax=Arundo donax TaxID=35708 RepID=A0A0A9AU15_ARUDO
MNVHWARHSIIVDLPISPLHYNNCCYCTLFSSHTETFRAL